MSAIQGGNHVAANVADCALSLLDRADVAQSCRDLNEDRRSHRWKRAHQRRQRKLDVIVDVNGRKPCIRRLYYSAELRSRDADRGSRELARKRV